jgi:hypothetical protein
MSNNSSKDRVYLALTIGTLVIVGGGIIALIYGPASLLTSLPFLLFGAGLILLLWWLLSAVGRWRERSESEYQNAPARHIGLKAAEDKESGGTDNPGR